MPTPSVTPPRFDPSDDPAPYFEQFEDREPPECPALSPKRRALWQVLVGLTVGLGVWYLHWRWTESLNPDAMVFSVAVAMAETLFFLGALLFFHDIWDEGDTPQQDPPETREDAGLDPAEGPQIGIDLFITTYDEEVAVVEPSITDALALDVPDGVRVAIHLLDDGRREEMAALADHHRVGYITRGTNEGYKAGNLKNALFQTTGDFVAICDADTRLRSSFLRNTLGYFRDPKVAWVQTPHWFYDIPDGEPWGDWLAARFGSLSRPLGPVLSWITASPKAGQDPFLSEPGLFFDVIQRRRNRNGASFCCGAGSIHRREAIFEGSLTTIGQDMQDRQKTFASSGLTGLRVQPFRFHVSEDIFTSILLHSDPESGWRSVFHPRIEARMLSPWSMDAWATQKLKYAGGTLDILLNANPLFKRGMPWRIKLHYAATFWSYISILWAPILMMAPVIALLTGIAPVQAYSGVFFAHLLPLLLVSELAMVVGCKRHDIQPGRTMSLACLPISLRAFWMILRGRKPRFPPTPKTPVVSPSLRHAVPNLVLLGVLGLAAAWGSYATWAGLPGHSISLLTVNLFWIAWTAAAVARVVRAALWRPPVDPQPNAAEEMIHDPAALPA